MYKRGIMRRSLSMVLTAAMLATTLPEAGLRVTAAESIAMETASADIINPTESVSNGDTVVVEEPGKTQEPVLSEEPEITEPTGDVSDGKLADETVSDGNEMLEENEVEAETAEIVASNTINGCTWTLDADGKLTIRDSEGEAGESGDWGFSDYKNQIISVDMDISIGTNLSDMFAECTKLKTAQIKIGQGKGSASRMFYKCRSLTSLDVSGFDTQSVTDMGYMFYNCSSLTSLDVSGFDTQSVTDMGHMFYFCSSLTSLDVSGFDTQNVTSMSNMFTWCSSLTSLDVSGFDTKNVTDISSMFNGCSSLTSLDVSGFDTQNVTDMGYMFDCCSSLTSLDVSGFDTQNVTDISSMFNGCSSLTSLDVSGLNTQSVTNMSCMFGECSGLTSLDVSGLDTQNVTNMSSMFHAWFLSSNRWHDSYHIKNLVIKCPIGQFYSLAA